MKQKKVPMRRCVVSQEMYPKKELLRIVRNKEGEVAIDATGKAPGRGAYIAKEVSIAKKAKERHSLDKALNTTIDDAFYDELKDYIEHITIRAELLNNNE